MKLRVKVTHCIKLIWYMYYFENVNKSWFDILHIKLGEYNILGGNTFNAHFLRTEIFIQKQRRTRNAVLDDSPNNASLSAVRLLMYAFNV